MKKTLSLLLAGGMMVSMLSACSSASSTASTASSASTAGDSASSAAVSSEASDSIVTEPVSMTLAFADGDETFRSQVNRIVDDFNAAYPDITITVTPGDGGSYDEFLKTKDGVGEFPDIAEMRDAPQYVRAGKIAPLSDDVKDLFLSTVEFDGVTYVAPYAGGNTMGIIYNVKYFEENNLEIPTTYDEFLALCDTIRDLGDMSPLVIGGSDIFHIGFLYDVAYTNNIVETDPDFIEHCYDGSKTFADDNFKGVLSDLSVLLNYGQDGWASTPDAQITTFFVNDMSAMMFSGTHMFASIEEADPDFEYGWFAIPDRDGNINLYGGGTAQGWALSSEAAQDPNKQAAFDAFMKFFFSDAEYGELCEQMAAVPTTKEMPTMNVSEQYQTVLDALESADALHLMWNNEVGKRELPADFRNFTYKTCIEVAQGTRDIDSAVEELQKTWDVALESFNPVTGLGVE